MQDERKTKQQLLTELAELRTRLADLEASAYRHRQTEMAPWRESDLLKRIVETSPLGIIVIDREGRITFANARAGQIAGLNRDEIATRTYDAPEWRVTDHEGRTLPDNALAFSRVITTAQPVYGVREAIGRPDGRRALLSVNGAPLLNEAGQVNGMVAMVLDATEQVRAEKVVHESEGRFRSIFDNTVVGVAVVDTDGQVTMTNEANCRFLGYSRDELVGRHFFEFTHPQDLDRSRSQFDAMMRGECDGYVVDERYIRKEGEVVWGRLSVSLVRDGEGRPQYATVIRTDITLRKQIEEEVTHLLTQVRKQAEQVQQIVDTIPEGILLLDADGRVLMANPVGTKDLFALADAKIGDVLTRLGDRPLAELLAHRRGEPWHEVTLGSPVPRYFEVLARPVEPGPAPATWVLVIRDVTREQVFEQHIRQQERLAAVGQMAGGIAHDFNNLLTTIMLYTQMLLRDPGLPAKLARNCETILDETRRATKLVQQILDFSRRSPIKGIALHLELLIEETVCFLKRTLPENIHVELDVAPGDYVVEADSTRIQQVLMNLALNARDAMPGGGNLRIKLSPLSLEPGDAPPAAEMPPGRWVYLSVSDTGFGMPPDVLAHLYEPFFTTKEPGKGTGLGLAQVHGIVGQHGGHIAVKTAVGKGTTFRVYLPASEIEKASGTAGETADIPSGRGEAVLLVEDNAQIREATKQFLESANYRVVAVANGREALEACRTAGKIDLVLTDVVMPEMGGVELIERLRREAPHLKALVMTGHVVSESLAKLRAMGVLDVIDKPFESTALARAIRSILDAN